MGQAMAQAVEVLMARVKEVAILIPASKATKVIRVVITKVIRAVIISNLAREVSSSINPGIRVTQSS